MRTMPPPIPGLKRVNISIEGDLHKIGKRRARKLGFRDGFSGYVARLLKLDMKRNRKRVANETRLLGS